MSHWFFQCRPALYSRLETTRGLMDLERPESPAATACSLSCIYSFCRGEAVVEEVVAGASYMMADTLS